MTDIQKLAKESGAGLEQHVGLKWWTFSPDELQLFAEKIQQAERVRYKQITEALITFVDVYGESQGVTDELDHAYNLAHTALCALQNTIAQEGV